MNTRIDFSVDDVLKCLFYLQDHNADSIFCSSTFSFAKSLWQDYRIPTTFNVFLQSKNGRTIGDVSSKWRNEFIENSQFIKFSFHGKDSNSNYGEETFSEVDNQYHFFVEQAHRIWGDVSKSVRLHFFSGNQDTVKALAANGIKVLYTSDDSRICYDLKEPLLKGELITENIIYRKTDFRLENMTHDDISLYMSENKKEQYVIFTHEKFLRNEEILQKMKWVSAKLDDE